MSDAVVSFWPSYARKVYNISINENTFQSGNDSNVNIGLRVDGEAELISSEGDNVSIPVRLQTMKKKQKTKLKTICLVIS